MEMDNCGKGVVVLAATNHPETIDASILRPGKKRADLFLHEVFIRFCDED